MSVRIEPFAGACDGSVDSFVQRVEFQVKYGMANVEESEKMQVKLWVLTDHLKDNARVFYDSLPYATKNDFQTLTEALKKKYSAREDPEQQVNLLLKIGNLKQDGRRLEDYLDEARGLFEMCAAEGGTRAYTIRKTLEGLSNASVRTQVMLMTKSYHMFGNAEALPPTFDDVSQLITTAEQGFSPSTSAELAVVHKPSAAEREKLATHELWLNSQRESEKRFVQANQDTTRELVKGLSETFGPLLRSMEAAGQLHINRSTSERPRVTYPVGQITAQENQPQGQSSFSGQQRRTPENSPCLNCYGMGHFRATCPEWGKIGPKARFDKRLEFIAKHGEESVPRITPRPATAPTSAAGPAPVAVSTMVDWLEDEIQDGEIACIDSMSEKILRVDDVVDAIIMGSAEWRDLPEEVVAALLGEEDLNTEDEEFIYDEIMTTNNKRTRVEAGISTDEQAGAEPQRRSQPLSKPRRTQKRSTPAVGGKNNPRRTNMMLNQPDFDFVDFVRHKRIEEKDGITWGQVVDKSPAWAYALAKAITRPNKKKSEPTTGPTPFTFSAPQAAKQTPVSRPTTRSKSKAATVADDVADETLVVTERNVDAFLKSDLARFVKESDRRLIVRNCYTSGFVKAMDGQVRQVKRILLDGGSTVDLINKEVAVKLGLQIVKTAQRDLSVADGYTVSITGRAWIVLTLAGGITQALPVLIMEGATPYTILLGIWGLYIFNASVSFSPLPATYLIRKTEQSEPVRIERDEEAVLQAAIIKARITAMEKQSAGGEPSNRQTTSPEQTSEESEGTDSEEELIAEANRYANMALDELTIHDTGYDTDTDTPAITRRRSGNASRR